MWIAARRSRTNGTEERAGSWRRARAAAGVIRGLPTACWRSSSRRAAPRATACSTLPRGSVCEACWASLRLLAPPLCDRCGDQIPSWRTTSLAGRVCARCRRKPSLIVRCRAFGSYDGQLRLIIHALKYDKRRSLARRLASLMRERGATCSPAPTAWCRCAAWRRLRLRGFNQAADLAGELACRSPGRCARAADAPAGRAARQPAVPEPARGVCAGPARRPAARGRRQGRGAGGRCGHDRRDPRWVRARAAGRGRA
jgi:predicted amidophosphoribosyltransferase